MLCRPDKSLTTDSDRDRSLAAYDYDLPADRIAQNPVTPRDSSRLLVVTSPTQHHHSIFRDLPDWLQPGDLLVLNDTRVIPARLYGHKTSGAAIEILLLEPRQTDPSGQPLPPHCWLALVRPGKRMKVGSRLYFGHQPTQAQPPDPSADNDAASAPTNHPDTPAAVTLTATILAKDTATGGRILQFHLPESARLESYLEVLGQIPLPPYIDHSTADPDRYQTVYAREAGSAAAPTAGLHFTESLFTRLQERGIEQAFVTLHVGVGTFRPVEATDITAHAMHSEWFEIPAATIAKIQHTQARGGRIIAVGTTVVRSLEGVVKETGSLQPFRGRTNLFIYPGYQWQVINGLITNFHLPKSSLLMLVSALLGRERTLALYQEAIAHQYRFYSFGDAMLILPSALRSGPDGQ